MKNINSLYIPISNVSNKYIEIVQQAMKKNNISVIGIKELNSINKLRQIDVVNLNWFESRIDSPVWIISRIKFVLYILLLYLFKIFNIKIVVTMHNQVTHDAFDYSLSKKFMYKLHKLADKIVVMNNFSKKLLLKEEGIDVARKSYLIPHPTYTGAYEDIESIKLDDRYFNIAFIGQVRPYKNIETILNVSRLLNDKKIRIYICGYAEDGYRDYLLKQSIGSNVIFNIKFLNDAEMNSWIKAIDAIILPYNKDSSLNSGVSILAFSYGKTVIGTSTGTLKDFPKDLIYQYDYTNNHEVKLKNSILTAYNDFFDNKELFYNKGKQLKKIVDESANPDIIGKKYRKLYESLLK